MSLIQNGRGEDEPEGLLPLEAVPSAVIRIEAAPGTDWENQVPLEITILANDRIGDYGFTGNDVSNAIEEERGDPLFSSSVISGSVFYAADQVTGMVASDGGSSNQIPANRPGWSSFIAANLDPRTGAWVHWINASARGVNVANGADWEYQIRYFSGAEGFPAKLEIGTVPNAGFFDGDEIAPENYSVEIDWQVATAELPALTGYQAYEMIRTRFLEDRPESLFADPVDTATGAQSSHYSFLEQNGVSPFSFDIFYYSLAQSSGSLGRMWSHGFEKRIEAEGDHLLLYGPRDGRHLFAPNGEGAFICQSPRGSGHVIVALDGGGWELQMPDASREEFDAAGRMTGRVSPENFRIDLDYDSSGRLERVVDPVTGYQIQFSYSIDGKIEEVSDGLGRAVVFAYEEDLLHYFDRSVSPEGGGRRWSRARFVYDPFGRLQQGLGADVAPDGTVSGEFQVFRNQFDPFSRIVAQWGFGAADGETATNVASTFSYREDRENGQIITVAQYPSWNTSLILSSEIDERIAAGEPDHADIFTHNENGELIGIRYHRESPLGEVSFVYDDDGQVSSKTDIHGVITDYARDSSGRILSETVNGLGTRSWGYDTAGRTISFEDRNGAVSEWGFDASGRLLEEKSAEGFSTTYGRNMEGLIISEQPPSGGSVAYTLENGMIVSRSDPLGRATSYSYDSAGRLIGVERADGTQIDFTLDHLGQRLEERINGTVVNQWTYDYREPHRPVLISHTDRHGEIRQWDYAEPGETKDVYLTLTTHPVQRPLLASSDSISETLYDYEPRYGTISRILTDPGEFPITPTWLSVSHSLQSVVPSETIPRITATGYDGIDSAGSAGFVYRDAQHDDYGRLRRVGSRDWPMGDLYDLGYMRFDDYDRPVALTADFGEESTPIRSMIYDSENQLEQIRKGETVIADFSYDLDGRLTATTFKGLSASQTIAADGLTSELTGPAGDVTGFGYDIARSLQSITWPDGNQTLFETDAAGRTNAIESPSGKRTTFVYNAFDEVLSETDEDGTTTYQYDPEGRLSGVERGADAIQFNRDSRDRMTDYTDSRGNSYQFTYDNQDNLTSITYPDGSVVEYTYVAGYNLAGIKCAAWGLELNFRSDGTLKAGYHTTLEDDARRVLLRADGATPVRRTISREETSLEINKEFSWSVASSVTVEKEGVEAETTAWDWDPVYFTPDERILPESTTFAHGVDGRVNQVDAADLTYDADGQLIIDDRADGYGELVWSARGKLLSAGGVDYSYDPAGNLKGWSHAGDETRLSFVPFGAAPALFLSEDPTAETVYYVHGPDGILAEYSEAGGLRLYHYDPAGNATFILDKEGNILSARQYEPFGKLIAQSNEWPSLLGYRGREGLPTAPNGLVYMNARHYAPDLQAFVSPDPILPELSIPASFDRYAFAYRDPLIYTDPTGLAPDAGGKMAHTSLREAFEAVFGRSAEVLLVKGDVKAMAGYDFDRIYALRQGMFILPSTPVRTESNGRVMIRFPDGNGRAVLGPDVQLPLIGDGSIARPPKKEMRRSLKGIVPFSPGYIEERRGKFEADEGVFQIKTPNVIWGVRG